MIIPISAARVDVLPLMSNGHNTIELVAEYRPIAACILTKFLEHKYRISTITGSLDGRFPICFTLCKSLNVVQVQFDNEKVYINSMDWSASFFDQNIDYKLNFIIESIDKLGADRGQSDH